MTKTEHNQAFIDGQNLYMNTKEHSWQIDFKKFRIYLQEKYKAEKAYYFIGAYDGEHQKIYDRLQDAGYILVFREHTNKQLSNKKGNVDTDIVFYMLSKIIEHERFDKVILVSGDGDYWRTVNFLIQKGRFAKLLAPNRKTTSSLYKRRMADPFLAFLDDKAIKQKIKHIKRAKKISGFALGISPFGASPRRNTFLLYQSAPNLSILFYKKSPPSKRGILLRPRGSLVII